MTDNGGMTIRVGLSTSSVYPENAATAFATARNLGYDTVEVMVWTDPVTQEAGALRALARHHGIPIVSVHAPTLLVTDSGVRLAVENMYPWRTPGRETLVYLPHWDPTSQPYDHVTLDLSHTATAGSDALAMARALGPRLTHLHLTDGLGSFKDEHLVPGRGRQPCAELLQHLADIAWPGEVVVEVNTRKAGPDQREIDLAEALAFARLGLVPTRGASRI